MEHLDMRSRFERRHTWVLTRRLAVYTALLASTSWADQPNGGKVSLTTVPAAYKAFAVAAGQRLQNPGKERITGAGTLLSIVNGQSQTLPVQIVWQIPLKIRIDGAGPTVIFDQTKTSPQALATQDISDMVEALLDDSVEGLLSINGQGGASRLLGTGFRDKAASKTAPSYDVVHLVYPDPLKKGKTIGKAYWFDSRTKLLSRVTYVSNSGSAVEVDVGNWQNIQGENIPFLVERRENNILTMRLTLSSALVSPAAVDATFGVN